MVNFGFLPFYGRLCKTFYVKYVNSNILPDFYALLYDYLLFTGMYKQLERLKKEQSESSTGVGGSSSPCNINTCGSNGGDGTSSNCGDVNMTTSVVVTKTSPSSSPNNLGKGKALNMSHKNSVSNIISSNNNHQCNNSNRGSPSTIAAAVGRLARLGNHHFVEDMISGDDDPEELQQAHHHHHHHHHRRASVSPLMSASRVVAAERDHQLSTGSSPGGVDTRGITCWEVLALNISPDLGERIMLSGERVLIEEAFPETGHAVMDARSSVAWHHDARHVIRFPLNGYCKLNSVQAITRLLNMGYQVAASHGGGVDSQQFSEYLFIRKAIPL